MALRDEYTRLMDFLRWVIGIIAASGILSTIFTFFSKAKETKPVARVWWPERPKSKLLYEIVAENDHVITKLSASPDPCLSMGFARSAIVGAGL